MLEISSYLIINGLNVNHDNAGKNNIGIKKPLKKSFINSASSFLNVGSFDFNT